MLIDVDDNRQTKNKSIKCCICGTWIERILYGGYIKGEYIDYNNKHSGQCNITLCTECMAKLMQHLES